MVVQMRSTSFLPLATCFFLTCSSTISAQDSFTVVGLPDTQKYSEAFPDVFMAQTAWVIKQRFARDIRFVSHYGDVVEHGDDLEEWEVGNLAMLPLDDVNLPCGVNAGNHDITANGVPTDTYIPEYFLEFFGPQRYEGRSWYWGSSPSGMSSYQVIQAGGQDFLMLNIECDSPLRELSWAQSVLDLNRDKPVFMTTHRYMQDAEDYTAGVPLVDSGRYPDVWYIVEGVYADGGIQSNELYDWFIRRNTSIFLVNCGHFHEQYRQQSPNVDGNTIHEVLADFQDDPNGGNGWLRIMEFDLQANLIDVDTYSPWLDAYRTNDESDFVLSVDFDSYVSDFPFAVFQQDINNYQGTLDTWVSEADPNTAYGDDSTRSSDDDVSNSFFSDDLGQALVGFQGVFDGDQSDGQIPAGSVIVRAVLNLQVASDIDSPIFSPDFYLYQVNIPWDESSTWNSLDNGLSGSDLGAFVGAFSGDNSPNSDGLRRLEVTEVVQSWSDGVANHGFAILPEIINGNDEGIEIHASEAGNPLFHPRLEITYIPPDPGSPADYDGDGDVDGADLSVFLSMWGTNNPLGDFDSTGVIDGADLSRFLSYWGR
jgi:hypothetical protein